MRWSRVYQVRLFRFTEGLFVDQLYCLLAARLFLADDCPRDGVREPGSDLTPR